MNVNTKRLFTEVEPDENLIEQGNDVLYLLLIHGVTNDESEFEYRSFEFVKGRQNLYDMIKDILEPSNDLEFTINVDKSRVYGENPHSTNSTLKLSNGWSVYTFMKHCKVMGSVIDNSSFAIDEFHVKEEGLDVIEQYTQQ